MKKLSKVSNNSLITNIKTMIDLYDYIKTNNITVHETENEIIIHSNKTLVFESDKHIVLKSGNIDGNYTHNIHLNPEDNNYDIAICESGSIRQPELQSDNRPISSDVVTDDE